jgi:hypothetical protein
VAILSPQWRARAAEFRRCGAGESVARAWECAAEELDEAVRRDSDQVLSVRDAAHEAGYSEEHIRRTLRQNPELNCGRRGKPAIRRANLPRKATAVARGKAAAYDPAADARSLMSRQGEQ